MPDVNVAIADEIIEQVVHCINMRIGVIETGQPHLTANDAIASGQQKLVKALSDDQKRLILELSKVRDDMQRAQSAQHLARFRP